jgi:hypothetical protein
MENLRVMTGQQDDIARYCILKVLNTRGQHLELGKNVPLGQAEPLRGPHPRVPESTSAVTNQFSEWKKFPGTEGKAKPVGRAVGTPLTSREADRIVSHR